ncbi:MAG: response regulator [Acidobacteriia bacterium]|nr:response regulator [Terriglobia bacterium]
MILLVEDNPADVGLVRKCLEAHGVQGELVVLADGEIGVVFIQEVESQALPCPDLAIIDLNLPKRPGRDVVERMRQSPQCRDIPIVVLSSSDALEDRRDAARFGADQHIRKPSRLEDFLNLGALFKSILSDRTKEPS